MAELTQRDAQARLSQAALDRGDLLDLLRRIAEAGCYVSQAAVGDCFYCGCCLIYDKPHRPDCPAELLEVLRG